MMLSDTATSLLGRKDTMYLSTIGPNDVAAPPRRVRENPTQLKTDDIDGARPQLKGYKYTNKEEFLNKVDDIYGTSPARLIRDPSPNRPIRYLTNHDIEKSRPAPFTFKTNRVVDPVNPVYQLPSYEIAPAEAPKFIRDSIEIKDIAGTSPDVYFKWGQRDTFKLHDIDGTNAAWKYRRRPNTVRNAALDVTDINGSESLTSKRVTDPNDPVYDIPAASSSLAAGLTSTSSSFSASGTLAIGPIEGAKPRALPRARSSQEGVFSLTTQDIFGCQTGTVGLGTFMGKTRREVREINKTEDIRGAQADTKPRTIPTQRQVDPLNPKYAFPGHTEYDEIGRAKSAPRPSSSRRQSLSNTGSNLTIDVSSSSHSSSHTSPPPTSSGRPPVPESSSSSSASYTPSSASARPVRSLSTDRVRTPGSKPPSQSGPLSAAQKLDQFIQK